MKPPIRVWFNLGYDTYTDVYHLMKKVETVTQLGVPQKRGIAFCGRKTAPHDIWEPAFDDLRVCKSCEKSWKLKEAETKVGKSA